MKVVFYSERVWRTKRQIIQVARLAAMERARRGRKMYFLPSLFLANGTARRTRMQC